MDVRLLIEQYSRFALTIISPTLYGLSDDKSTLFFHDEDKYDLFFIYLNEFIKTEFVSPINEVKKVSLFTLLEDYFTQYKYDECFNEFLNVIEETKCFFLKKRYYRYYISPHEIDLEISFGDLINIQSNYSKHSYYHLNRIKGKLKKIFEKNNVLSFEQEDYNEHLEYFKEAVLDDRLSFNQTMIVEQLGRLFLAYWDLLNSDHKNRIDNIIREHIINNGRMAKWDFDKPENLNDIEEFFWLIKGRWRFERKRIYDLVPKTHVLLIERETAPNNMIERHR